MNIEILKKEEVCYNLSELLNLYSTIIKNPLVVINHNYELVYFTHSNDVDKVYEEATKSGVWSLELIALANHTFKDNEKYAIIDSINKNQRRLFYKIEHNGLLGYLVLLETSNSCFSDLDFELLAHLVNSIGKILYLRNENEIGLNVQSFYLNLINNNYKNKTIIESKIEEYKIDLSCSLLIISLDDASFERNNYLKIKLEGLLKVKAVIPYHNNVLIFFNDLLPLKETGDILAHNKLRALYVKKIEDYNSFSSYYNALANLLNYLKKIMNNVLFFEEYYKVYLPFFQDTFDISQVLNFINPIIFKIYKDDIINNTENINTIYHYLLNDRSLGIASANLFIHKNTVSYRLMKLNELYNIDFDDNELNKNYLYSVFIIKYYDYKKNYKLL